jgi:hypothetical protein
MLLLAVKYDHTYLRLWSFENLTTLLRMTFVYFI